ncbi:DNA/RNA nuclease SfsA [Vagococcus coleopterorum]|uniref:Sugar fermentation stimulation protein homolog n=1 Tax=Vagococcus coleopterorum TaxID=2714946 RepID=A0A6G8APN8_9ENTE|nr:DNA/RNA nuclease SfsA [Vagococcus coleopterorum]QIL46966.1 DNA/RNA nuclease SfsA [Vagococcus coleopterorum]
MEYPKVETVPLLQRDNRFIAQVTLPNQEEPERVHVKNTGRCKELLFPGAEVAISYQGSATRKTDYDLIAANKNGTWVNIDSQVPNQLAAEGIASGAISLPGLVGPITEVKREVTFGSSRFDVVVETATGQTAIVEVKGMTLEANGIGAFPDAPSLRALKHVKELAALQKEGYQTYVLFIAQLESVSKGTVHTERQPELSAALQAAMTAGTQVLVYNCQVTADTIELKEEIAFDLAIEFKETK